MIYRTTVSAVIRNTVTGKYLLVKQPANVGVYPGQWAIPGGGIDSGETMYQALERECREEVGLEVDNIHPLRFADAIRQKHHGDGTKDQVYMIMLVFICDTTTQNVTLNNEADEYQWLDLDAIITYDLNPPTQDTFAMIKKQT